jgi:Peptidase family M28
LCRTRSERNDSNGLVRTIMRSVAVGAVSVALLAIGCRPRHTETLSGRSPVNVEITAADLRSRLFAVAADSTQGRAAGSTGALRVQRYLISELRLLGLTPAGEGGGYSQAIRTVVRHVGASSLAPTRGAPLAVWRDFAPVPWPWIPRSLHGVRVVFGGELGGPSIEPTEAAGRFVIMRQPNGRTVFPRISPNDPLHLAAAVAVVGLEQFATARLSRIQRGLDAGLEGTSMLRDTTPASLLISTAAAEKLLGGSLRGATIGDTGVTVEGAITLADSTVEMCCNVIGLVRGADAALAGEYVALGAHLDHLGTSPTPVDHDSARAAAIALWNLRGRSSAGSAPPELATRIRVNTDSLRSLRPARQDSIFNGADDDASGTVALLEIAKALTSSRVRPRRSILLVWHTGEELGNLGSTWFTDHPTVPLDSVVAQLNVDMIGRGAAADIASGGPRYLQVIGARRMSREFGDLIEQENMETGVPFKFDYEHDSPTDPQQLFCRSDHFEYARYGIPIAFFTTGEHPDYHQVTDEPQYIDYAHLAAITTFIRNVAVRVANLDHRLVLDREKPDPTTGCQG